MICVVNAKRVILTNMRAILSVISMKKIMTIHIKTNIIVTLIVVARSMFASQFTKLSIVAVR